MNGEPTAAAKRFAEFVRDESKSLESRLNKRMVELEASGLSCDGAGIAALSEAVDRETGLPELIWALRGYVEFRPCRECDGDEMCEDCADSYQRLHESATAALRIAREGRKP